MVDDIGQVAFIVRKIDDWLDNYPWWCITKTMQVDYVIRQLKKERDAYRKKMGYDE